MRRTCASLLLFMAASSAWAGAEADPSQLPPPAPVRVDFTRDIKPILLNSCWKCHGDEKPKSRFRLTTRDAALKGGQHGLDIFLGESAKSPLIHYVARQVPDMEMPPEGRGTPLTAGQIALLRAWIDQGVPWETLEQPPPGEFRVSPTLGWTGVSGDAAKFRELYWQPEGWNGGLEQFDLTQRLGVDSELSATGHVRLHDYQVALSAEKNDLGFTRFGWSQYRKYFDNAGGDYPEFSPSSFELNRDLSMDVGRAWAEFGLTLPRWPRLLLGYEYQYRDGARSTLQWGPVSNGAETRNIYPAFKDLLEQVHIMKFDADYELGGVLLTDNFRGEWYELSTHRSNDASYQIGAPAMAITRADESQTYFQGANTFHLERQFTDWLFASGGYLYSKLESDASLNVETLNPTLLAPTAVAPGWRADDLELERESHVFSLCSLAGPWEYLTLSLGVQNEWTRQRGLGSAQVDLALPFAPFVFPADPQFMQSDLDRALFSQNAGLRFTGIPFTALFADARFQQEDIGLFEEDTGGLTPFLRQTDSRSDLEDLRVGFNTSPWRRVSWSADYRWYDKTTDYDNRIKEVLGMPFEGYPGFIRQRRLFSQQAETKLALQATSWLKATLTYKWLGNEYHTATDPVTDVLRNVPGGISSGGSWLAGTYDAHILSLNTTLTPWRRVFLSTTFAYQNARTVTAANGSNAVAPYEGGIYSVLASGTFIVDDKTDFTTGYSFSTGDFGQNNFAGGLPLGINYQQHTVQAGISRRVANSSSVGLQYRFYHYAEPGSAGLSNFDAHAVFATLALRLP